MGCNQSIALPPSSQPFLLTYDEGLRPPEIAISPTRPAIENGASSPSFPIQSPSTILKEEKVETNEIVLSSGLIYTEAKKEEERSIAAQLFFTIKNDEYEKFLFLLSEYFLLNQLHNSTKEDGDGEQISSSSPTSYSSSDSFPLSYSSCNTIEEKESYIIKYLNIKKLETIYGMWNSTLLIVIAQYNKQKFLNFFHKFFLKLSFSYINHSNEQGCNYFLYCCIENINTSIEHFFNIFLLQHKEIQLMMLNNSQNNEENGVRKEEVEENEEKKKKILLNNLIKTYENYYEIPSKCLIYNKLYDVSFISTPYSITIINNNLLGVQFFLKYSYDVNKIFRFPILKSIINVKQYQNNSELIIKIKKILNDIVENETNLIKLYEENQNNTPKEFIQFSTNTLLNFEDIISKNENLNGIFSTTPLLLAAAYGNYEVFVELLCQGASINYIDDEFNTIFHHLSRNKNENSLKIFQFLLNYYQINKKNEENSGNSGKINNSLIYKELIKKLLLLYDFNGDTSLHIAVDNKNLLLVNEYLENFAINPNIINPITSFSPLHLAVRRRHIELIKLLLSYGADINLKSDELNSQSPYDLSLKIPKTNEIYKIFQEKKKIEEEEREKKEIILEKDTKIKDLEIISNSNSSSSATFVVTPPDQITQTELDDEQKLKSDNNQLILPNIYAENEKKIIENEEDLANSFYSKGNIHNSTLNLVNLFKGTASNKAKEENIIKHTKDDEAKKEKIEIDEKTDGFTLPKIVYASHSILPSASADSPSASASTLTSASVPPKKIPQKTEVIQPPSGTTNNFRRNNLLKKKSSSSSTATVIATTSQSISLPSSKKNNTNQNSIDNEMVLNSSPSYIEIMGQNQYQNEINIEIKSTNQFSTPTRPQAPLYDNINYDPNSPTSRLFNPLVSTPYMEKEINIPSSPTSLLVSKDSSLSPSPSFEKSSFISPKDSIKIKSVPPSGPPPSNSKNPLRDSRKLIK